MGRDPRLLVFLAFRDVAAYHADKSIVPFSQTHIMYLGTEALPARLASAFSQGLVDLDGSDIGETP